MADTRITVLDYRRSRAQGLHRDRGCWTMAIDKDDVVALEIDWTRWLDAETISAVTYTTTNITAASASESSGVTTALLSALKGDPATVDVQVTTSGGRKMTMAIKVYEAMNATQDAYAA